LYDYDYISAIELWLLSTYNSKSIADEGDEFSLGALRTSFTNIRSML